MQYVMLNRNLSNFDAKFSLSFKNMYVYLGPDSRKVSSLGQISVEIFLKSEIFVSADFVLKLRFTKGISAETKISAKF